MYADIKDFLVIRVQVRPELRLHWKCKPTKQDAYIGSTQLLMIRTKTSPQAVDTIYGW